MNRHFFKLTVFFIIVLIAVFGSQLAQAKSIFTPGDTPEEVAINREILESDDEYKVVTHLRDLVSSVRMTACMRLGEIGTSYSLSSLLDIATSEEEDFEVKDEASFAIWYIKYREAISGGGNGESLLLEILNRDGDITKTLRVIAWAMELLGDMGSAAALPLLQMIAHLYIPIASYDQLQGIQYNDLDGNYILVADIDCDGFAFVPIGTSSEPFTGTFDGGGFTISNLTIYRPGESNVGLFGYTNGAEIINVGLENVNITGHSGVAGLAGDNYGTIRGCYVTGSVETTYYEAGGLVGFNHGLVRDSYARVDVSGDYYLGGLVAWNYGMITNTYATGTLTAYGYVGGLVGFNDGGTIENSFATTSIIGREGPPSEPGGLIGYNTGYISDCYWNNHPGNPDVAVGFGDGESNCTPIYDNEAYFYDASNSPMSGCWDFTDVWVKLGDTYPILETIISDTEITPSFDYLKEAAEEALIKIEFINSFPPGTGIIEIIEAGLEHDELCVRGKWACKALLNEDSLDLEYWIIRLETLFSQAEANEDYEFTFYVANTLEALIDRNRSPAIEITYPLDDPNGDNPLKERRVEVFGCVTGYGIPEGSFSDIIEFNPGPDNRDTYVYTKEVKDEHENVIISESITVHYYNNSPDFVPISDKEGIVGGPLNFTVSATDIDDTDLLYFVYNLPQEDAFDYDTHTFTWTPQYTDVGTHKVTFEVDDGYGLTDTEEVTITVTNKYDLAIDFGSQYGIWTVSDDGSWSNITGISPKTMVAGNLNRDNGDELILDLGPQYGVWARYNDGTWSNILGITANSIVIADTNNDKVDEVFVDIGPQYGIWKLEDGNASPVHGLTSKSMIKADLDGNGTDELVIDFGPLHGIWAIDGSGNLFLIHGLTSSSMIKADLDGDNKDELVIDFGPSHGIWTIGTDNTLSNIYPLSPNLMLSANLDSNNKDELIVVFDSGIWIRHDTASWEHINGLIPESITAVDLDADNKDELIIDFGEDYGIWVRKTDGAWAHIYPMSPRLILAGEFSN